MDKPQGWTSHDVVAHVKRKLNAKKVGHLGTLDPLATGVLVLVIDSATKFASSLGGGAKEYVASCKLGEETDTYDREGKVLSTSDTSALSPVEIKKALEAFKGRITQVPPMYSALKSKGVPLYKLARKGVTIEREAREIEVYEMEPLKIEPPIVEFRALCSGGTYVRSICHDLGVRLGCGGHLAELRRTRSGAFTIEEAVGPGAAAEELSLRVIPLDEALRRASGEAGGEPCQAH
ncbi:MAG TPA: tRNA pseudouridine(55) synthase TruB [Deltaproteobacteria bacterium]|nr:MAG: tRNA pseudouridine(55) synthase TruB [Deltaproteobacteria bacterium GWA2_55_82]OIJ75021.1 MAG: tRNA pseudouridine(55) synthase TruB [Deltaproteobacteria bacterium GWC2_55_46]HBG45466.1 tRNA pseudouridine(55) synthase TruB [Deltaproteobacteria bacterium]HCY10297.1 tRNA pseudouridine(55) synthase TruB [Deltaproteobacteria bacterium]